MSDDSFRRAQARYDAMEEGDSLDLPALLEEVEDLEAKVFDAETQVECLVEELSAARDHAAAVEADLEEARSTLRCARAELAAAEAEVPREG